MQHTTRGLKNASFQPIGKLIARSRLRLGGFGRCPNPSTFHTPSR